MKKEQSFWVAVLAGFVVLTAGDILIHEVWLKGLYRELAQYWRPADQMKANTWLPFLSAFSLAFLLAHIYPMGAQRKPGVTDGLRFGIWMGLLLHLPSILIKYYVYPYPKYLFIAWFVGGTLQVTVAGVAIALAYQKSLKT
jgi:hypothetical protein